MLWLLQLLFFYSKQLTAAFAASKIIFPIQTQLDPTKSSQCPYKVISKHPSPHTSSFTPSCSLQLLLLPKPLKLLRTSIFSNSVSSYDPLLETSLTSQKKKLLPSLKTSSLYNPPPCLLTLTRSSLFALVRALFSPL